ncbi:hypothetical protein COCSADRAFT_169722 [Bipolaris sorokiniana ND90Pr]|uniref:Dienelactone hydrolase domain-containing protein n=1 Tax=Cochliobolus sativus (strain ND90Pr / ATCC 201652) TaxID=665912 RepID=M2SWZ8_COCSN|nr:uncharacterized protein COCSADRAFT_169722 [Bipolaris sorokiniana ND90Pr]EMD66835.1 hypothetical protein COCSADRAFT_169722 [Bipolaris sorokiniana ND90Pr]
MCGRFNLLLPANHNTIPLSKCCVEGTLWDGEPVGQEKTYAGQWTYVSGNNNQVAIWIVYDAFGFGGEVLPTEILKDTSQLNKIDLPGFLSRNSKEIREPELLSGNGLVDCISTAHPSLLEMEIEKVGVPVQILAPENNFMFLPDMKAFVNMVIPNLGVPYDYQHFSGVEHGFATRGDMNSHEYNAAVRAHCATIDWFKLWLHKQPDWNQGV